MRNVLLKNANSLCLPLMVTVLHISIFIDVTLAFDVTFHHTKWAMCKPLASGFRHFIRTALSDCALECALRNKCTGVGYREHTHVCELFSNLGVFWDDEGAPQETCVFVKRSDMGLTQFQNHCADGTVYDEAVGGTISCTVEECADFNITGGVILGNMNSIGAMKKVMCSSGFEKTTGDSTTMCQNDGTWSHNPDCVPIECPPINITNGAIYGDSPGTIYTAGTMVTIVCNQNFQETTGKSTTLCQNDATWDHNPVCDQIVCPPINIENGVVYGYSPGTIYTVGASVTIVCNQYFQETTGQSTTLCQNDTTWDHIPVCDHIVCPPINIENGAVYGDSPGTIYTVGASVTIVCNQYFQETTGQSTTLCQNDATWGHIPVCDQIVCPPINIANGAVYGYSPWTIYTVGASVTIVCSQYFQEMTGQSTALCQNDATWSHSPVCGQLDCASVSIYKGIINPVDATGRVLNIGCENSYHLGDQNSTMVCLANGTWSHIPICVRTDCPQSVREDFKIQVYLTSKTREGAKTECEAIGAHLVKIDKSWKMNYLSTLLASCSSYSSNEDLWTDGYRSGDKFYFYDGVEMPSMTRHAFWEAGSSPGSSMCVRVEKQDSTTWRFNDKSSYTSEEDLWTDGYKSGGQYNFHDGVEMPLTSGIFWESGAPDSDKSTVCVRVAKLDSTTWRFNDKSCDESYPFICEY